MPMSSPGPSDLATADGHDRYVPSGADDILAAGHEGVYQWVAEHLVGPGARVLDLGCGTGYGSVRLAAAGATVDGIDSSPAAVDHATLTHGRPGIRFFVGDVIGALPGEIEPGSYDVVFSSEVIEHVVDPFAYVDVMRRHVTDDGACFVGTPNRLWSYDNMPDGALLARSHVIELTPPALVALLRGAFEEVDLMFRVFPESAIRATLLPGGRSPLVSAAAALARQVAPGGVDRLKRLAAGRSGPPTRWTPDDIDWVPAERTDLDAARCVGLAAVCRRPRR